MCCKFCEFIQANKDVLFCYSHQKLNMYNYRFSSESGYRHRRRQRRRRQRLTPCTTTRATYRQLRRWEIKNELEPSIAQRAIFWRINAKFSNNQINELYWRLSSSYRRRCWSLLTKMWYYRDWEPPGSRTTCKRLMDVYKFRIHVY